MKGIEAYLYFGIAVYCIYCLGIYETYPYKGRKHTHTCTCVVRKRGGRDNLKTPIECQQGFSVTITIEIYRVSFPTKFSLRGAEGGGGSWWG
jgi:hypothetical protein